MGGEEGGMGGKHLLQNIKMLLDFLFMSVNNIFFSLSTPTIFPFSLQPIILLEL